MSKVLTKEQAREKGFYIHLFTNGDYKYADNEGIQHLIRNGKEIAQGKWICSYENGFYEYQDNEGIHHLIEDGEEIMQVLFTNLTEVELDMNKKTITIFNQNAGSEDLTGKLRFMECDAIQILDEINELKFVYKSQTTGNSVKACFNLNNISGYVIE